MLVELFPRVHRRYTSLAIIGPILDGYGTWLLKQGYSTERAREHFRAAPRLVHRLQQRSVRALTSLTRARLRVCAPTDSQEDPELAVLVRQLTRYCESELSLYPPPALTRVEERVAVYRTYLQQVRGFAPSTVTHHDRTASEFLAHIGYEEHPTRLAALERQDLVAETFGAWCLTLQHLASGTRRARMRVVRNLCLYRRRSEPGCFVPDERLFPPVHQAIRPHIFTDNEIVQLLAVARTLARSSESPLRAENMRLAIVVLSTTGLRRGELTQLTVGDYDPPQRTLAIRQSKFHKSRLVPLSADTAREIEHLIEIRDRRRLPAGAESPLLWHRHPPTGGYSGGSLGGAMRALSAGPASGPRRVIPPAPMISVIIPGPGLFRVGFVLMAGVS